MLCAVHVDDYFVAGIALAVSLVNESPAPAFFAKELFQAIVSDPDKAVVPHTSLPESKRKTTCSTYMYMT